MAQEPLGLLAHADLLDSRHHPMPIKTCQLRRLTGLHSGRSTKLMGATRHVVVLGHEGVPRVLVCLPYHCQLQEEVLAAVGLPPGAQAEAHAVPLEQEGQPRSWEQSHWGGQQEGPLAEVVQVQGHGHRVGHSWLGPFRPQPGHGRQGPCPEALQGVGRPLRP